MFIQGDLQVVFDALYESGVIDPILKMDWSLLNKEISSSPQKSHFAIDVINQCRGDRHRIIKELHNLDETSRYYVAMEVAREFAEYVEHSERVSHEQVH